MTPAAPAATGSWVESDAGHVSSLTVFGASHPGGPRFTIVPRAGSLTDPSEIPTARPPRVAVIVPSNRPAHLSAWEQAWWPYLTAAHATLYVVRDEPETWAQIQDALGVDAWIIPRQTDCVRMWGYLQAVRDGADILITLDDDCLPTGPCEDAIREHVRALTTPTDAPGWGRVIPDLRTRGIPHEGPCPVVNHGLWTHVPDLDAVTQLAGVPTPTTLPFEHVLDPARQYPLSGMNLAWRAEITPLLYFGLMGSHLETGAPWGVDRFGDIWAGLAAQRVARHCGWAIRSGTPFVHHARASDPQVNLVKERPGSLMTSTLAAAYRQVALPPEGTAATYADALADTVSRLGGAYWAQYGTAWHRWIALTA